MRKIRIVVVDDSAYSRRSIIKMLEGLPDVEVVGYAINGEEGIHKVATLKPDLVTLDLEMPKMDGFTLLRILTSRFSMPVIVISALSGADKVFKALELGALDFIAKPSSSASPDIMQIRENLHEKVLQVVNLKPGRLGMFHAHEAVLAAGKEVPARQAPQAQLPQHDLTFDVVAIGASTGGPPALQSILAEFDRPYPFAVVVSQHMPVGFTRAFADRLNRLSHFTVKEAQDGDPVLPGHALIAPGGMNMIFENRAGKVVAKLSTPTQADRYVPSVDVMLESCASVYGNRVMAVILTGMGNDGSKGVRAVKQQGGYVVAESEETAVVYGMPREAAATGVVDRIVPLQNVARSILSKGAFL